MDLDMFIITVFYHIDDAMKELLGLFGLRQRGPAPALADSEVLTMEVVAEYLGMSQDKAIYDYFRRHYAHFFPAISRIHRTTFVRQAANLFRVKARLWQHFVGRIVHDHPLALVDSLPMPVCQFARAYRCQRFRGQAAYGKDILTRQTFYGFRVHMRVCWPGVISRFELAPANVHETEAALDLAEATGGLMVGDRNYWRPYLKEELAQIGVELQAPYRSAKHDPWPARSALLSRVRYRIDTVFGQLVERYHIKRVWAKDSWHLHSRLLRKVFSHTIAIYLNQVQGHPPLQLAKLLV